MKKPIPSLQQPCGARRLSLGCRANAAGFAPDNPLPFGRLALAIVAGFLLAAAPCVEAANKSHSTDLLKGGLKQWTQQKKGAWEIKDGVLQTSEQPGGYIWTKKQYGNFEISVDYKTSEKCNSGLFFRTDPKNAVQGGFEIQIASAGIYSGKHVVGSLYDAKAPSAAAGRPDGEWNTMVLTCKGPKITVVLNGKKVMEADIDDWDTANQNPDGSKNKFKTALKDLPRTGHIGLQYHGHPVWFRNIRLKKL